MNAVKDGWWIRAVVLGWLLLGGMAAAHAEDDNVWQFVDRDGVVHIGNSAPPTTQRKVIWLSQTPQVLKGGGRGEARGLGLSLPEREVSALKLPGFETAKPHLEAAARSESVEPALVIAVAAAESAFNTEAVSRKGALGLMQVMPATAERYGVSGRSEGRHAVLAPQVNAQVGSRYLADLLRMFDGDKELALAAYNAGEGAVLKYGRRIPPYPETQQYVDRVMRFYRALTR
ncbi:MAG: transglycosylase SLT domain-containing protein [Acidovorax sp.]